MIHANGNTCFTCVSASHDQSQGATSVHHQHCHSSTFSFHCDQLFLFEQNNSTLSFIPLLVIIT